MIYCKDKENITERILRKLIIAVMVLALVIPVMTPSVFAASSVTISSGDNVKGGDTFTVAVTFGGGDIGRVEGNLTYDTDMLTYVSGGSSTGNSGYIQLSGGGTDGSVTFNIEFQALKEGSTTLQVATDEMYDLNEVYMEETPSASKEITIAGTAASEEVITQTTSPEQPVEETELQGVDEKPDDDSDSSGMTTILMIAVIAIPVILIIIIIAVLAARKKRNNRPGGPKPPTPPASPGSYDGDSDERVAYDAHSDYGARSDHHARSGYDSYDAYDERNAAHAGQTPYSDRQEREEWQEERRAVKKRASEETRTWSDWEGFDDNDLR